MRCAIQAPCRRGHQPEESLPRPVSSGNCLSARFTVTVASCQAGAGLSNKGLGSGRGLNLLLSGPVFDASR